MKLWKSHVVAFLPEVMISQFSSPVLRCVPRCSATERTTSHPRRSAPSPFETRASLLFAVASQTSSVFQRSFVDVTTKIAKVVFPTSFDGKNLEEALMSVPNLETVSYEVIARTDQYEIREVSPYYVAETTMPGKAGFDFNGASQSFNVLASYLFGKNRKKAKMEMTTPVYINKAEPAGEQMEMTTPVITKKMKGAEWKMSFVMPSKYGAELPLPKDSSVKITQIPGKVVAVSTFSGFVTDEIVEQRELMLRRALKNDMSFKLKEGALIEVAQYNPPFTLPFQRRNEIALEVVRK